jgi:predicted MFS family arabinose efflux permease
MRSSLATYREVVKAPGALKLLLASLPSRTAYGMISLSIYFKVQQETGSIAIAGLATGLNGLAGALTAGIRGAVIDRFGMIWPLRILVPSYAALIVVLSLGSGRTELVVLATLLGLTAPPINLSVRPLWKITVPTEKIRTAFALDTATMNSVGVFAPVIATTLSLSVDPALALQVCAFSMFIGGILLLQTWQVRQWQPERKEEKTPPIWRIRGIQLLAVEGVVMGLGWGAFDIGLPAFGTLEGVPERVGIFFSIMAAFNVIGGLVAGTISRKISPLRAFRTNYLVWAILSIPLAFTHMDWSIALVTALLAFFGGAQQVFYWEITEAVRPKGTAVQAIAWLWTIEGTAAAIGMALGGYIAEEFSPRICFAATTIALFIGYLIISSGKRHLKNADDIPTPEEDVAAMEDNVDNTR